MTDPQPPTRTPEHILIGVAWPYASGPRHLGHVAGPNVPADIFARYNRMIGNHVLMVSGSDMHGTPILLNAEQADVPPSAFAHEVHRGIVDSFDRLGMTYDLYTETTTPNHHRVTQDIFLRLFERGYIVQDTMLGTYDPAAKRFLPDRFVEGTCPHCGYTDARGDQCDNCGRTLDPIDLVNPRSKLTGATPEMRETTHFFLDLPQFSEPLLAFIDANADHWRANVTAFTRNWIEEGLKPRAITRDIDWGVPIPRPGFEDKRIYVWFDAVIGYLSASIEWAERRGTPDAWKAWWEIDAAGSPPGRSYYFIGKDNIPFHAIIWPAMLMGYGGLALPYDVPANEYLTVGGQKISSSRSSSARLPWLPEFLDQFDADALRYFLTINAPERGDTEFSWEEFQRRTNDELVATYGNAVHRLLRFVGSRCDGRVPTPAALGEADQTLLATCDQAFNRVGDQLAGCHFREGLRLTIGLAQTLNKFLDVASPWKTIKTDPQRAATSLWTGLQAVSTLRVLTAPFLPFSAQRLHTYLGDGGDVATLPWRRPEVPSGRPLPEPEPLFRKLEDDELEDVLNRFR